MDQGTKRATPREIQRHLFIGSLHREMDKLEAKRANASQALLRDAGVHLDDGCSEDETVDMLVLDGVSPKLARNRVAEALRGRKIAALPTAKGATQRWNFVFEDASGRIWSGSEFGLHVTAATREEAMQKAEELIAPDSDSLETVVDVRPAAN